MSQREPPSIAILGSARPDGHTSAILKRLVNGYDCEIVDLLSRPVASFNYEGKYPSSDPFLSIVCQIVQAPVTLIATPVYWYSYSTCMKVFIDRFSDLLSPRKEIGRELRGRHFALVTSSSEPFPDATMIQTFTRFCDYLGIHYVGCAHAQEAGELVNPGEAAKIQSYLRQKATR